MNAIRIPTLLLIALFLIFQFASAQVTDYIKIYTQNNYYWEYKGQPVLLLGGSKTDHIFLADSLEEHLDEIVAVGGNYVRNTMSQREGLDLKPHKRLAGGGFDLNQWNTDYWNRFSNCLQWCNARDIIIQIEVWDRFDYSQDNWLESPWHPDSNVNYTNSQTGLADTYPEGPWRDLQPFFHTIPGMTQYQSRYDIIRGFQEKFVDKMLSYSLNYGNVLYCMNNETSTDPKWGQYWISYIKNKADSAGVTVFLTDMFDDAYRPEQSAKLKQEFDNPDIYTFVDISQINSRNFDETHWDKLMYIKGLSTQHPRPLNCVKIYGDGNFSWGSGLPPDGIERFWRDIIGGCASARHHRDGGGIGLRDSAKACIKAMRKLTSLVKPWDCQTRQDLLSARATDEAYLMADTGMAYGLYFTDGGSVGLDLTGYTGGFDVRWISLATGEWANETAIVGGGIVTISAPSSDGWAAAIVKAGTGINNKADKRHQANTLAVSSSGNMVKITYSTEKKSPVSLSIYDVKGCRMFSWPMHVVSGKSTVFWQARVGNGCYLAKLDIGNRYLLKKFIILE
jgi:hypothetical protein